MPIDSNFSLRWEPERVLDWYGRKCWLVGCNYIPSTAVNQLEMWQEDTFDSDRICVELGWAAEMGMNTLRVFLHNLVWEVDPQGFVERIDRFLEIAAGLGFSTLMVLLDDCWNPGARAGKQSEPIPGVHNSRWLQCPGATQVTDPTAWPGLKRYVLAILKAFAADERVLAWDLYNEPGNSDLGEKSLPLLQTVFKWAREVNPSQPLTAGLWADLPALNDYQVEASDVISFHHYGPVDKLRETIGGLRRENRPILCTEYMARTLGSLFETHLPVFAKEQIGCYNWGLVAGKTQTHYPWNSPQGADEPKVWFADILRGDGTPYSANEVDCIKRARARFLPGDSR